MVVVVVVGSGTNMLGMHSPKWHFLICFTPLSLSLSLSSLRLSAHSLASSNPGPVPLHKTNHSRTRTRTAVPLPSRHRLSTYFTLGAASMGAASLLTVLNGC